MFNAVFSSSNLQNIIDHATVIQNRYKGKFNANYARKIGGQFAYNIGFIDGYGWYKTRRRLKEFFNDCPNLLNEMDRRKISEENTLEVLALYTELCAMED